MYLIRKGEDIIHVNSVLKHYYPFEDSLEDLKNGKNLHVFSLPSGFTPIYNSGKVGKSIKTIKDESGFIGCYYSKELKYIFQDKESWSIAFWINRLGDGSEPDDGETILSLTAADHIEGRTGSLLRTFPSSQTIEMRRFNWGIKTDSISFYIPSLFSGWHFIVWTYSKYFNRLYIDNSYIGGLISNISLNQEIIDEVQGSFFLGAEFYDTDAPEAFGRFNGYIDQLRIYQGEITLSKINELWNGGVGI